MIKMNFGMKNGSKKEVKRRLIIQYKKHGLIQDMETIKRIFDSLNMYGVLANKNQLE